MNFFDVCIPPRLNSDYQNICTLYEQVDDILSSLSEGDCVRFNFEQTTWFSAEMTVYLGMIITCIKARKAAVKIGQKSMSTGIRDILLKNQFLNNYGTEYKLVDNYNTTIPYYVSWVEEIEQMEQYIDNKLLRQIQDKTSIEFLGEIKESLLEIIHNVRDHSESNTIYMCGQHYPRRPYGTEKGTINFAIADCGIGLVKNIKKKNTDMGDVLNYFKWAFDKGTSTKNIKDSGVGLYELKNKLIGKGEIKIIANNGYYHIDKYGNINFEELHFDLPGTLVLISFYLDYCQINQNSATIDTTEKISNWFI
jgi:ATP-binding region, ATPase family protein